MKNDVRETINLYIKNLFTYVLKKEFNLSDAIEKAKEVTVREISDRNKQK